MSDDVRCSSCGCSGTGIEHWNDEECASFDNLLSATDDDVFLHWLNLPTVVDWWGKASPFSVAAASAAGTAAAAAEALRFIDVIHLASLRINTGAEQTNTGIERDMKMQRQQWHLPVVRLGIFGSLVLKQIAFPLADLTAECIISEW